jgi:hypothetical protein
MPVGMPLVAFLPPLALRVVEVDEQHLAWNLEDFGDPPSVPWEHPLENP